MMQQFCNCLLIGQVASLFPTILSRMVVFRCYILCKWHRDLIRYFQNQLMRVVHFPVLDFLVTLYHSELSQKHLNNLDKSRKSILTMRLLHASVGTFQSYQRSTLELHNSLTIEGYSPPRKNILIFG